MIRIPASGICFVLALVALSAKDSAHGASFIRGDTDASGKLEITDGIRIFGYLFRSNPGDLSCHDAADVNDDGSLNLTDGIHVLLFLVGGGEAPPAPFPNCGLDPTDDEIDCRAVANCPVVEHQIGESGGVIEVTDSDSPLNGVTLTIPPGAVEANERFSIAESPYRSASARAATPAVRLNTSAKSFAEPLLLTLPLNSQFEIDAGFVLQRYNPQSEQFESTLFRRTTGDGSTVTFPLRSFSDYQAEYSISIDVLRIDPVDFSKPVPVTLSCVARRPGGAPVVNHEIGVEDPIKKLSAAVTTDSEGRFEYVTDAPLEGETYIVMFNEAGTVVESVLLSNGHSSPDWEFDYPGLQFGDLDGQPTPTMRLFSQDNSARIWDVSPQERKQVFGVIANVFSDTVTNTRDSIANNPVFWGIVGFAGTSCAIPEPTATKGACVGGLAVSAGIVGVTAAKEFAFSTIDHLPISDEGSRKIKNIVDVGFLIQSGFNMVKGFVWSKGNNIVGTEEIDPFVEAIDLATVVVDEAWTSNVHMDSTGNVTGFTLGAHLSTLSEDSITAQLMCYLPDSDSDGVPNHEDNCPNISNREQVDSDENGIGDACDRTSTKYTIEFLGSREQTLLVSDINDSGDVVGWARVVGRSERVAFSRINGILREHREHTRAFSILNTGTFLALRPGQGFPPVDIWQEDGFRALPPPEGWNSWTPIGMNENGQILANARTFHSYPVIYEEQDGKGIIVAAREEPGGSRDINDFGQVTGKAGHAFFWDGDTYVDIGAQFGYWRSEASAINNAGWVVGYGLFADFTSKVYIWSQTEQLEIADRDSQSAFSADINESNQVVFATRIWDRENGARNVIDLIPEGDRADFIWLWGSSINENGQIGGYGYTKAGLHVGFIVSPARTP